MRAVMAARLLSLLLAEVSGAGFAIAMLYSQVAGADQSQVATQESPWSPAMVTALFGGLIGLIGAVSSMIMMMLTAKKERAKVAAQVVEVHDLVNSSNTALLEQVAALSAQVADLTRAKGDIKRAAVAEHNVAAKAEVTADATARRDAADEAAKK